MAATIIGRSFRCLRQSERDAAALLALASITITPYVPVAVLDLSWSAYPSSAQTRYIAAFKANFKVSVITVTIDGESVSVYQANQTWMIQLAGYLGSGCLSTTDPLCQRLTFPSPPDPDCIYL